MKNPANSKYVKKLNRMNIVNIIINNESISRQEIAELTGLTPAAITGIIRELIVMGFVKEEGLGESQGGRRPVKLTFNCKAGYVIGVEVTSEEVTVAIADLKNPPASVQSIKMAMKDPEFAIECLAKILKGIMHSEEHADKNFLAIAVAFPALFTMHEGVIKRAVNLGRKWDGFPLKKVLEEAIGLPVLTETNSKVAALGEKWFGAGTRCKNLIYINMGEGISAGIIMGDCIVQGSQGYAGQIGHTIVLEQGPLCNCGNRGCLEAICGIPALVRKAMSELPFIDKNDALRKRSELHKTITFQDIIEVAMLEESYARDILRQSGRYVALATANMINLYNPDEVFIGGKLAVAANLFIEEFREIVSTHVFPGINETTNITVSRLGAYSGVIGACALALKNLLKSPHSVIFEDAPEGAPLK